MLSSHRPFDHYQVTSHADIIGIHSLAKLWSWMKSLCTEPDY